MEYYQLEHPRDRILLCTHSDCNEIADYLELTEAGAENVLCASHTSSERHVSVLQKHACRPGYPFREMTSPK